MHDKGARPKHKPKTTRMVSKFDGHRSHLLRSELEVRVNNKSEGNTVRVRVRVIRVRVRV